MLSDTKLESYFKAHKLSTEACDVILHIRSSDPSRRVKSGTGNAACRYPSQKMGFTIQAESHTNELAAVYQWEHEEAVYEFYDQPPRIKLGYQKENGRRVSILHTPDFFLLAENFTGWVECKTEEHLQKLSESQPERYCRNEQGEWVCPPGEAYAAKYGLSYKLRSSAENDWTLIRNLIFLSDYLDTNCPMPTDEEKSIVRALFERDPWIPLLDLLRVGEALSADAIYKLIVEGDIYFSLYSQPISDYKYAIVYRNKVAFDIHRMRAEEIGQLVPIELASPITLTPGSRFNWGGMLWQIDIATDSSLFIRNQENHSVELDLQDVEAYIVEGKITGVVTDLAKEIQTKGYQVIAEASPAEMQIAVDRYQLLQAPSQDIEPEKRRSASSIKAYHKKFSDSLATYGNGLIGLFPKIHLRGNRNRKLDDAVIQLMENVIQTHYLQPSRPTFRSVYGELLLQCVESGLEPPSEKTFRAEIKKLDRYEAELARGGRRAAYKYEQFYWRIEVDTPRHGERPFQIAHIDHTLLDVEIGDHIYGTTYARPWWSVMLDAHSRKVLATWLSFDEPSYRSCMMVIRNCIKSHQRIPNMIVVDGGTEFDGVYFETLVSHLKGIKKSRAKSKARYGTLVERFFGIANTQLIHNLKGNTQATRNPRGCVTSHDPKKHVAWTLNGLRDALEAWIEEVYEASPHKTLGVSPAKAFSVGMLHAGMREHARVSYDLKLQLLCLPTTKKGTAKVDNVQGVTINYLNYWCQELTEPVIQGKQVPVRYDPDDASVAYVYVYSKWIRCRSQYPELFTGRSTKQIAILSQELKAKNREMGCKEKITAELIARFMRKVGDSEKAQRQIWRDQESRPVDPAVQELVSQVTAPAYPQHLDVYEDF